MPVVVLGPDAAAVAGEVDRRRMAGERVAGFVGDPMADTELARSMGTEMLSGGSEGTVDVVIVPG